LEPAEPLPNGAVIDARAGTVALTTALDARGHTQQATFRGARFEVRQPRSAKGMVDLYLRETPSGCGRPAGTAVASAKKKPARLWGKDSHGKYRTHGLQSIATVRGTEWSTTETCAGTLTTVRRGAVSVRDRGARRSVLVRAGHRHLAR
jgi:hypothetical protein